MRIFYIICLIFMLFFVNTLLSGSIPHGITVKDALLKTELLVYPSKGKPVDLTVVEAMKKIMPNATVMILNKDSKTTGKIIFSISIIDEGLTKGPGKYGIQVPEDKDWMFFRLNKYGEGELVTSKPHLLYALSVKSKIAG